MNDGRQFPPGMLVGAVVAASFALTGCVGQVTGAPTPTASGSPSPAGVSGTGPTGYPGVEFPLGDGARSVSVEFECASGSYTVELSDSMMLGQAPYSGECAASPVTVAWPITDRTTQTLGVLVDEGVPWRAIPTFSEAEFPTDEALSADCGQFAVVYSGLMNADTGYTFYGELDAEEWARRVSLASQDLATLAGAAQSNLREVFAQLVPLVDARSEQVGVVLGPEVQASIAEIGEACSANQTPLILQGEFGG